MAHKFIRSFIVLSALFLVSAALLSAQPCADTQPVIAGSQVVTNNQTGVIYSTPNIPGHTYTWTISGGTIITGSGTNQVTVTWGVVGNGSITVLETNTLVPCSTSVSKTISIQPLLISYFYYTNTSCYGDIVSFWDASVFDAAFPITSYYWTFGDGGTSTLQNPQHQYLPPFNVTYPVMLIVTNSINYKDTIYDAVYVNPDQFIPHAEFSSNVPNCLYTPVSFNSTASTTPPGTGNIFHWDWNFGDPASGANNISHLQNPDHVFSTPNTYTVFLEVTNERYCKGSITHQVVITPSVPTAQFIFSSPSCLYNPVFFTNQSFSPPGHNIAIWEWNFGDGSMPVVINAPANPNVMHIFPGLGPYPVQLKATNDLGCSDSTFHNVSLDPSPLANFTWDSKCFGDTIKFTNLTLQNNGPAIASYLWNFGDPGSGYNTSTLVNPSHVFSTTGTFNVTLQATNISGCPDTVVKQLTMFPPPTCDYTWQFGSINQQILFHIDSSSTNWGAIGNMVIWNFGDGTYGYGWNPIHLYPTGGTYDVTLTVTDTIGCHGSILHQIFVPALPMAFFSSNSPVCDSLPVCFTDLSNAASPPFGFITTWIWDFGDGSPQDTILFPNPPNVCHIYPNADTFAVTLKVFDNFGLWDSYTTNVFVLPNPIANFFYSSTLCPDQLVSFTDASTPNGGGNIISWSWNFADPGSGPNNFSNLTNPTHIFTFGDSTYFVRLIVVNFNNCTDTMIKPVYIHPKPPVDFTYDTACLNQLVHFHADTLITHIDSIASWIWDFGDGTPAVTDPISTAHLYGTVGVFTVTLTITDIHGCTNFITHVVQVNPLPVAAFTWVAPVCQNSPVQFTDHSFVSAIFSGFIVKWLWEFGDGTDSTIILPASPNISHIFVGPALSHTVRLTVWTNDSCTSFVEHIINTIPKPIANFDYSVVNCSDQAVQFTDLSQTGGGGNIAQWSWDFGDPGSGVNNFSTLQNPSHTYVTGGTYFVKLTVTNVSNCFDTITKPVTINVPPVADFKADTACLYNPTTFTDLSIPNAPAIISYSWSFGDGSPLNTQTNPVHTYGNYGIFSVTLTIVNSNGCTNSITKQVLVNPLPTAAYNFPASNCEGTPVCYTDLSTTPPGYLGNIVKWVWDFGDGTPPTTILFPVNPNICHTFAGFALSHVVRLTVATSDSCTDFIEHTVNSIPSPIANFGWSATTCANSLVLFNDLSQLNGGGPIISWNWNFGDPLSGGNNSSTLQNPGHSFTASGNFNVTLIIHNTSNCPDTIVQVVSVNQLPVADFSADTACVGNLTTFTDLSVPNAPSIVSWAWNFGDGSAINTTPNPTYTYANYGLYNVTLTITNSNGCVHSVTKQVLVLPLPVAAFTYNTPTCQGAVVNYTDMSTTVPGFIGPIVKWVWDFGDGTPSITIWFPNNPDISHVFAGAALSHIVRLTVTTATPDSCTHFVEHTVNSISAPLANFGYPALNCINQSVLFSDQSQMNGGGPIVTWDWNFGDPGSGGNNTSNAQNPVHLFSGTGTFDVTLIVFNSSGCSDTIQKSVDVSAKPVASFTADTVCKGTLTTFTDQSTVPPGSGSISSHFWDFGDGGTSTQTNPTHLYADAGTYPVTLTVTTTHGCTKDTTIDVIVHALPTAAFSFSSPTCAEDSVQFTDLSTSLGGAIVRWFWQFGDGQTKNVLFPISPNVKHAYANAGTFNVILTVTTSDSCSDDQTLPVTIQPKPQANFDYAAITCQLMPLQFTDLSQGTGGVPIVSWLWDFGDPGSGANNTSTQQNPSHSFSAGGTFDVFLTITNANGCLDTITKPVNINAGPVAKFTADTACVGSPTQFADSSTAGSGTIVTWQWNFGDPASGTNNTSTQQNPTHIFSSSGTYNVTLLVTNSNSCEGDTVIPINVNPSPDAMFSYAASCVGDSTQFTDLSIAPGSQIVSWLWDFGDGGTSTQQNPNHAYMASGTYNVQLKVTNLSGCTDSIIMQVTARPKPIASFIYTSFFCPAGQVNFQDQSQGVGAAIVARLWIFEPGYTSTLINPVHVFGNTNTTYLVTLIVTDNYGCKDTIIDSVYVKPGFSFTFTHDTVCFGLPTHFLPVNETAGDSLFSTVWDFGDPASGQNNHSFLYNPTHIFTSPGSYIVKLKAANSDNCVDSVFKYVIVRALPAPAFQFATLPCDSTIYFTDSSFAQNGSISTWIWNYGDGSPPDTIFAPGPGNTSHLYVNVGFYTVFLKVTNSYGCSDTVSRVVQRFPCIKASFEYNDTLLCARYPISFSDSSLPISLITQWHWYFGDGTDTIYTNHTGNIVHIYPDSGSYVVKLKIDALVNTVAIIDSMARAVIIHPTPITHFSNLGVCKNNITLFRDTSNTFGKGIVTWNWNFGEPSSVPNDTSTFKNPSHKYDTAGSYDVKLVVMNRWGCKDSLTKTTRVFALPVARFDNSVACSGNPTTFTDNSITIDTTIMAWRWNFGDLGTNRDTSEIRDPVYKYPTEGDYLVRMIVIDHNGCLDTVDSTIRVNITPVSSFTLTNNLNGMTGKIQLNNISTGATFYQWEFGNGTSSTEENPVATYTMDGTYVIMLISSNQFNCSDTTFFKYEVLFKGLYVPNAFSPTNTNLAIRLFKPIGKNLKQYNIQVYSSWGHLLWESNKIDSEGRPLEGWDGTFNGTLMPQGTYMWKASATFIDDTIWQGSDVGKGESKTMGTVSLIR